MAKDRVAEAQQKLKTIDSRIAEIRFKSETKLSDIETKKEVIAGLVASLAMGDNPKLEEELGRAKKSLERMQESLKELQEQAQYLAKAKVEVNKQFLEASLSQIPELMSKQAADFDKILVVIFQKLFELSELHQKLKATEKIFKELAQSYQSTTAVLGILRPLEGEGSTLGPASRFPAGWQRFLNVDIDLGLFVQEVLNYGKAICQFEDTLQSNPKLLEDLKAAQDKMGQPFELPFLWSKGEKFWPIQERYENG